VLDLADVAPYLLDRRLISARAVVDGRLRIIDVSRLNRVFVVTADRERCLVLKSAGEGSGSGVAREAAVLERLSSVDGIRNPASSLPVFVAYDTAEEVLILESTPGARDLAGHHARGRFSCALAREAGRALARLHSIPPVALDGLPFAPQPTWIRQLHRPDLDTLRTLSGAAVELTRILQGFEELCTTLDEVLASWREDAVIHGDVRWDNCLVWRRGESNRWAGLQLIDWELSGVGDPGCDVGTFLGEYLRAWLESMPISDPRDPGRLLSHARLPLRRMRPALRAFWDAYSLHRRTSAGELSATLHQSTRFAAVRLLTAALEEAQTLAELQANVLYLLPVSQNILRRPREAADLLGLGAWWAAA
jgi:aminoglycoside phosphotransferase (APT) family kinase protein